MRFICNPIALFLTDFRDKSMNDLKIFNAVFGSTQYSIKIFSESIYKKILQRVKIIKTSGTASEVGDVQMHFTPLKI